MTNQEKDEQLARKEKLLASWAQLPEDFERRNAEMKAGNRRIYRRVESTAGPSDKATLRYGKGK